MTRVQNQLGEKNLIASFVNLGSMSFGDLVDYAKIGNATFLRTRKRHMVKATRCGASFLYNQGGCLS